MLSAISNFPCFHTKGFSLTPVSGSFSSTVFSSNKFVIFSLPFLARFPKNSSVVVSVKYCLKGLFSFSLISFTKS
tara:strand:- start:1641 stop:1865 length:225 start_codon:yes stop_codon:yes gene_type:complete